MRNPTWAEIDVSDGSAQTVDFGKHANQTYGDVLTSKPQYAVYLMTEDDQGPLGSEEVRQADQPSAERKSLKK